MAPRHAATASIPPEGAEQLPPVGRVLGRRPQDRPPRSRDAVPPHPVAPERSASGVPPEAVGLDGDPWRRVAEVDPGDELTLVVDLVLGDEACVAGVEQQPGNPHLGHVGRQAIGVPRLEDGSQGLAAPAVGPSSSSRRRSRGEASPAAGRARRRRPPPAGRGPPGRRGRATRAGRPGDRHPLVRWCGRSAGNSMLRWTSASGPRRTAPGGHGDLERSRSEPGQAPDHRRRPVRHHRAPARPAGTPPSARWCQVTGSTADPVDPLGDPDPPARRQAGAGSWPGVAPAADGLRAGDDAPLATRQPGPPRHRRYESRPLPNRTERV